MNIKKIETPPVISDFIRERIQKDILEKDVVLYMKGTPDLPCCGFSSMLVQILRKLDVPFRAMNVLDDDELRQSIKIFSNWPTIPQLYVKGEFIGGCDIVSQQYQNGTLQHLLREKKLLKTDDEAGA